MTEVLTPIKSEPLDDPLDPLFFDIDEAFFDDFFNIDDPSTEEETIDTNNYSTSEVDSLKRKSPPGSVVSKGGGSAAKKARKEFVSEEISRIPKSDIRRTYPKQFADLFNKQDKAESVKVLERLALSDVVCSHRFVGGVNPTGPQHFDVKGIQAIAAFWDTYQQAVPDSVFEILETKIRVSSTDRRSAILCKWISKGTKIMGLNGLPDGCEERITLTSLAPSANPSDSQDVYGNTLLNVDVTPGGHSRGKNGNGNGNGSGNGHGIMPPPHSTGGASPKAGTKFGLGSSCNEKTFRVGTLTFQLNSAKKIYRLEFVYSNKKSVISI